MCIGISVILTVHIPLFSDANVEETAVAAYWVTDGVDRCRVGFLPRHCIRQCTYFDGRLVQVVAMLADSDNPKRQFSRFDRGACYAALIDTEHSTASTPSTRTATAVTTRHGAGTDQECERINAMALEILGSSSSVSDDADSS
jgi:hypothetical protein